MARRYTTNWQEFVQTSDLWLFIVDASYNLNEFRDWAEGGETYRYAIGGVEYKRGRGPHRHIAVHTKDMHRGMWLHGRFGGFWKNSGDSTWENIKYYISKFGAGIDEEYEQSYHARDIYSGHRSTYTGPGVESTGHGANFIDGSVFGPQGMQGGGGNDACTEHGQCGNNGTESLPSLSQLEGVIRSSQPGWEDILDAV